MPATKRGIYHNLRESKYVVTNGEIFFFFSSELYMTNFLINYKVHRDYFKRKIKDIDTLNIDLNMETLADITYYKRTEKRGFCAWLKGVEISWQEIQKYALRKMTEKNTNDWYETHRPKFGERLKSLV